MNELYHHGIKGMKWGVRRFQKKDGSLTSAGKKRYNDSEQNNVKTTKTNERFDKLYAKYKKEGYSDSKAKQLTEGQIKTEKVLKVVGGVAVTAVAAYATYKIIDNRKDTIISPTQMMQTVHQGSAADRLKSGNPFYATYTKADHKIYASKVFSHFNETSNVTQFYTNDGIKVASRNTGKKVLNDLMKSNKDIQDYVNTMSDKYKTNPKKRYDMFNKLLVLRTDTSKNGFDHDKIHNIFYDELRKRGYGAVIDVNDAKLEGFTFRPVIVFDKSAKRVISSTKATVEQLGEKRLSQARQLSKIKQTLNKPLSNPEIAAWSAIGGSSTVITTIKANSFIQKYKQQHPNTNLTDFQIANIYMDSNTKRR